MHKPTDNSRDKFSAVWVSHSSMGDFIKCPRLYYLHNVYKNSSRRKINITSPALALGVAVHEVLEPLSWIKSEDRMKVDFKSEFDKAWKPVSGKLGGFRSVEEEAAQKERGWKMIERVLAHPEPLLIPTLRMGESREDLPNFFITPEDNIILCGKVDWLQYNAHDDSITILDFKTGKYDENEDSLQLPIYTLLVSHFKSRPISGASYWYLDRDDAPKHKPLPTKDEAFEKVIKVARQVAATRASGVMECPNGKEGCRECKPFEKILRGEAEHVGVGGYNQDLYII